MWITKAIKSFAMSLLAFPLAPVIALISLKEKGLPAWAFPFLTFDNGIDGDGGHWERWPKNSVIWKFCRRTAWLWRNRAYNYSYYVTGLDTNDPAVIVKGSSFWQNKGGKGYCFARCGKGWMLFAWYPYSIFGINRGLRVYLGWKLRNKIDNPSETRAMLVTHINPFKGVI